MEEEYNQKEDEGDQPFLSEEDEDYSEEFVGVKFLIFFIIAVLLLAMAVLFII